MKYNYIKRVYIIFTDNLISKINNIRRDRMIKYEEHFGINIISTNLNNSTDVDFLTEDIVNDVEKFHTSIDEYKKTPLVKLDNLASKLGVKNIFVKDESYRYGLNAFKHVCRLWLMRSEELQEKSLRTT